MTCCFDNVRRHVGGSYGLIRFSHFSIILAPRCRSAFATHRLYCCVSLPRQRDTVRRFWWAWSSELLRFSARPGDYWLSGRPGPGCGRVGHPYGVAFPHWCRLHHNRDDWRDFPCSYFPWVRRWQGRLRICLDTTRDRPFAFPHRSGCLFACGYPAIAAAQALVLLAATLLGRPRVPMSL